MGGLIAFHVGLKKANIINGCVFINPAFQDNIAHHRLPKKAVLILAKYFPKIQLYKSSGGGGTKYSLNNYK